MRLRKKARRKRKKAEAEYLAIQEKIALSQERTRELLRKEHGKGFVRSAKQWQASIADHIGQIADNLKLKDITEAIAMATVAYYGYKVFGSIHGSAYGIISLKLATSMNMPAGMAGTAGLMLLGLASVFPFRTREIARKNLKDRGYSDEQIDNMTDAGDKILEEFHPFG
jgi:hypothetical protein